MYRASVKSGSETRRDPAVSGLCTYALKTSRSTILFKTVLQYFEIILIMGNSLIHPITSKDSEEFVSSTGLVGGLSGMQGYRTEMEVQEDIPLRLVLIL